MLKAKNVTATIAVKDLDTARDFYEKKLGFKKVDEENDMVSTYKSGDTQFFVYKSKFAGGYKATVATWVVEGPEVDKIVAELKDKGIAFEHYDDMPDTTVEGDVHVSDGMRAAWFKDPEGNILCVVGQEE